MTSGDLDKAFLKGADLLDRIGCKLFILDQTARDIYDAPLSIHGGSLTGDRVSFGIEEKYLTESVRRLLRDGKPVGVKEGLEIENGMIEFEFEGIPVEILVIKRKYKFFKYPDTKFYLTENCLVPNPFEKYWKVRKLIK